MKRVVLAITVLTLATSSVFAGGGLGLFGSYWDAEDADDPAMGGGLKFKMPLAPNICLELRASYLTDFASDSDEEALVPLEADLVIEFPIIPNSLTLYAGGGGGYYIFPEVEYEEAGITMDVDIDDEFGFFAIGGVELKLNESTSLFAEAKYTVLEVDGGDVEVEGLGGIALDVEEDNEMTGLGANAGLLVVW